MSHAITLQHTAPTLAHAHRTRQTTPCIALCLHPYDFVNASRRRRTARSRSFDTRARFAHVAGYGVGGYGAGEYGVGGDGVGGDGVGGDDVGGDGVGDSIAVVVVVAAAAFADVALAPRNDDDGAVLATLSMLHMVGWQCFRVFFLLPNSRRASSHAVPRSRAAAAAASVETCASSRQP